MLHFGTLSLLVPEKQMQFTSKAARSYANFKAFLSLIELWSIVPWLHGLKLHAMPVF